jgi:hypothetical protein
VQALACTTEDPEGRAAATQLARATP